MIAGIFMDTFLVLALAVFGGVLVGGTAVARRVLSVTTRKATLEATKMDIEIDRLNHLRTVAKHSQDVSLLQLTTGSAEDQAEAAATIADEENVKVDKGDIEERYDRTRLTHAENKKVEDGEYTPAAAEY